VPLEIERSGFSDIVARQFDPAELAPHLFEESDPGFHERCRPGDIIVTGRNFGMGPKMNGYIAMRALGLGLVPQGRRVFPSLTLLENLAVVKG